MFTGLYRTNPTARNNPPEYAYYTLVTLFKQFGGYGHIVQFASSGNNGNIYTRSKVNNNQFWAWQQQEAIVAKSLGTNGYIKYASGPILQWGSTTELSTSNPIATIQLPITFTSNYKVFVTPAGSAAIGNYSVNKVWEKTNAQFSIYSSPMENEVLMWFAIGN